MPEFANGDEVWTSLCRSAEMRSAPQVSSAFWGRGPSSERKSDEEAVFAVIGSWSAEITWPLVALLVSKPAVPTETPGGTDPWVDSSTSLPKSIEVSDMVDACAASTRLQAQVHRTVVRQVNPGCFAKGGEYFCGSGEVACSGLRTLRLR